MRTANPVSCYAPAVCSLPYISICSSLSLTVLYVCLVCSNLENNLMKNIPDYIFLNVKNLENLYVCLR